MTGKVDSTDENLIHWSSSTNDQLDEEEEEDEEALSLSDLPINGENDQSRKESNPSKPPIVDTQEEFNFCSWGDSLSKESEMCVADEVFFQGQILPMRRHSISFDNALITSRTSSTSISRSESMDHCSYSVGFTSASSRSSSINSYHSSSSGSSASNVPKNKPRPKIQNQFHFSHPSPKPQIRSSNIKNRGNIGNPNRKSTFLSFLRVGLVTTPEIAVQDLKFRTKRSTSTKNFGSRNSTSSISSTLSNGSSTTIKAGKKQKQHKFFDKNGVLFSGCKCSSNAIVGPIPSRVPVNVITRSSGSANKGHAHEEDNAAMQKNRTTKHQETGKQALSSHRTFEWLKQLSLEAAVVIDEAA